MKKLIKNLKIMMFLNKFKIIIDTMYRMYYPEFEQSIIKINNTNVLLIKNKFSKNKKKIKVQKRYYRISNINLGKDKYLIKIGEIIETNLINILKIGVKNKVNSKTEKLLNHKGVEIENKFINNDNKVKKGFLTLTTKDEYKVQNEDKKVKTQKSIKIDNKQKLSQEIVLFDDKDIDYDLLLKNIDKQKTFKYGLKIKNKFNNSIKNEEFWVHNDGIKDQKVSKNKIDKIIKQKDGTELYKIKKID